MYTKQNTLTWGWASMIHSHPNISTNTMIVLWKFDQLKNCTYAGSFAVWLVYLLRNKYNFYLGKGPTITHFRKNIVSRTGFKFNSGKLLKHINSETSKILVLINRNRLFERYQIGDWCMYTFYSIFANCNDCLCLCLWTFVVIIRLTIFFLIIKPRLCDHDVLAYEHIWKCK